MRRWIHDDRDVAGFNVAILVLVAFGSCTVSRGLARPNGDEPAQQHASLVAFVLARLERVSAMAFFRNARRIASSDPVLSNCVFCLGTWTLGDVAAQRFEHRADARAEPFELDLARTLRLASFGVLVNGPVLAKWYPLLDRFAERALADPRATFWTTSLPPRWRAPVVKVAIETACFDLFFLATFYVYVDALEGGDSETCRRKLETKLLPSFATGLAVWPATQLANFRFVPTLYQPYVVNVVAVVWDGYLSHKNHERTEHGDRDQENETRAVERARPQVATALR